MKFNLNCYMELLNSKMLTIYKNTIQQSVKYAVQLHTQYQQQVPNYNHSHSMDDDQSNYHQQEFQSDEEENHKQEIFSHRKIRKEAFKRAAEYVHPRVNIFDHQPINGKESQELRKQLVNLYKPKVEQIRKQHDNEQLAKKYQSVYEEFIKMTLKNQIQQRQLTQSIGEMYEMADILLHPPDFQAKDVFLHSKNEPTQEQDEQIKRIFFRYEQAYKAGEQVQQNQTEEVLQKAKQFLRDQYS